MVMHVDPALTRIAFAAALCKCLCSREPTGGKASQQIASPKPAKILLGHAHRFPWSAQIGARISEGPTLCATEIGIRWFNTVYPIRK